VNLQSAYKQDDNTSKMSLLQYKESSVNPSILAELSVTSWRKVARIPRRQPRLRDLPVASVDPQVLDPSTSTKEEPRAISCIA
jgi:DTW domain-containing protein YfiP